MHYTTLPITLRQMQYASAVADELNFRRAAKRCHVSQPSLSNQIAELERMLGVQLFDRDRRSVLVTPAGKELLIHMRKILLASKDLMDATKQHIDPLRGLLRLGVIPTISPYLLPDLDPALRQAFPQLQLRWTEDKTDVLVELTQCGELDAILMALEADLEQMDYSIVGEDPFVLAASKTHVLGSQQGAVSIHMLKGHEILLLNQGHCFRDQTLNLCAMTDAQSHRFEATSLTTLVQIATGGKDGITILPHMAIEVENRRARLTIRPFKSPAPHRTIVFAWRKSSALATPLRQLTKVARQTYDAYMDSTLSP